MEIQGSGRILTCRGRVPVVKLWVLASVTKMDHIKEFSTRMNLSTTRSNTFLSILLILLSCAGPIHADQSPQFLDILRMDSGSGTCRNACLSVNSLDDAAVGWILTDQDDRDSVYLALGSPGLWVYVNAVGPPDGSNPRDLAVTIDSLGRLHAVWTAMHGSQRRLMHALQESPSDFPETRIHLDDQSIPVESEADFPVISPDNAGGVHIVWQQTGTIQSSIHAIHVDANSNVDSLGRVSGVIPMAMSPQILYQPGEDRIRVAWYEIEGLGNRVRVDQWNASRQRWVPSNFERRARQFEDFGQTLFYLTELGLVAGWQTKDAGGLPQILIGLDPSSTDELEDVSPVLRNSNQPPGDHGQLDLSGRLPGRLTMTWSVLADGRQQVQIKTLDFDTDAIQMPWVVSAPEQRFASGPDHETLDNWSAVIWVDQARDGGNGGVYYREIIWP
jgi:hypothetical protein